MIDEEEAPSEKKMTLTSSNWMAFSYWFKSKALELGEAGTVLLSGVDNFPEKEPAADDTRTYLDEDGDEQEERIYNLATEHGKEKFRMDVKDYKEKRDRRIRACGKLLQCLSSEIRMKLEEDPVFLEYVSKGQLLKLWKLIEQVAKGRGTVSIYAPAVKIVRLRQGAPENFYKYNREFAENVNDLLRHGDEKACLEALLNVFYVLGLNQDQFREPLSKVYSLSVFPAWDKLKDRLRTYVENMERMKTVAAVEGEVSVMVAHDGRSQVCWNCDSTEHLKPSCKKPRAVCGKCGGAHLTKFHELAVKGGAKKKSPEKSNNREEEEVKTPTPRSGRKRGGKRSGKAKVPNKTLRNRRTLTRAMMADGEEEDDEEAEEEAEEEEVDDVEDQDVIDTKVVLSVDFDMTIPPEVLQALKVHLRDESRAWFILDTGCKRVNICNDRSLLEDIKSTKAIIAGVTGATCEATEMGSLPVIGPTLYAKEADANLISVRQLIRMYGGHFVGNEHQLIVYDRGGQVVLVGETNFGGFWICFYDELLRYRKKRGPEPVYSIQDVEFSAEHFTAEERNRALEAWNMCRANAHPGFRRLKIDLGNGIYPNCHLTAKDVDNAETIYGPCPGCLEGKMKAPSEPSSKTPPAEKPGDKLHCDLQELPCKSLGGNTFELFVVDEKTGYRIILGLKSKKMEDICRAWDLVIAEFNAHRHTIKQIVVDNEKTLLATKPFLAQKGILLTSTPTELHEKRAERFWQEVTTHTEAAKASLPYELPEALTAELHWHVVRMMNMQSTDSIGPQCSYTLFTGFKPFLATFHFGQVGYFYSKRAENKHMRAEIGVFVGYGDTPRSLRAYMPTRAIIYSRRKFVPVSTVPTEWGWKPRVRHLAKKGQSLLQQPPVIVPIGEPPGITPVLTPVTPEQPPEHSSDTEDDIPDTQLFHQEGTGPTAQTAPLVPEIVQPDIPEHSSPQSEPLVENTQSLSKEGTGARSRGIKKDATPYKNKTVEKMLGERSIVTESIKPQSSTETHQTQVPTRVQPKRAAKNNVGWKDGRYEERPKAADIHVAYRISLKKALSMKENKKDIANAINAEMKNMMDNKVLIPVKFTEIPPKHRDQVIRAHMFLKFKYKADGSFDKVKARLVANGDEQDFSTIDETFAPTVNPISVFTILNFTAHKGYYLSAHDVKGAFLLKRMKDDKKIYVKIGKTETSLWTKAYPEMVPYVGKDECLIFKLDAFMYGLAEAPNQFNELADEKLKNLGFKPSEADPCVYTLETTNGLMSLCIHVDDILLSSPTLEDREWFVKELGKHFELVSQYDNVSYLGMNITHDRKKKMIRANQEGYVKQLLEKYKYEELEKFPPTPYTSKLFQEILDSPSVPVRDFLGLTMSLMFIGRFTRPDILLPVTTLAANNANPTEEHWKQAMRIVRYLAKDPHVGVTFDGTRDLEPTIYADASHAIHHNGYGQAGMIMTLGSGPIHCRSFKLKLITRSSSESELVALDDAVTYAVWWKKLLQELKIIDKKRSIRIYQDNKSTIIIATQGGNFKRTKHFIVREAFIKEKIANKVIELKYRPTDSMTADFLTKPLSSVKLQKHLNDIYVD